MAMAVRIKICGITNLEDALDAVRAGADALGFVFHRESPRYVEPETVRQIVLRLPPMALTVGVFVNAEQKVVRDLMDRCGLTLAQLHGDEPSAYCETLGRPVLKAVRLRGRDHFLAISELLGRAQVRGILVDGFSEQTYGGTGTRADWELAAEAAKVGPLVLAGGLTSENVGEAIRTVHPYGVDVSSGVERSPGKKDPVKVRAFINAAKLASKESGLYTPSNE
jgi:phosphoribosylanthranilate isomerase